LQDRRFNGWVIYWACLMIVNLFALALSAGAGDFFSCVLSGFMLLFCGIALNENLNKNHDEER